MHSTCTHTGPRPSAIIAERCCSDWSDRGSSVMVRGKRSDPDKNATSCLVSDTKQMLHNLPFFSPFDAPASLICAAPCRMWTELPQALCIQHPKQLQRSPKTAPVHHFPRQQPVPASVHHWVGVQCRDGLYLHRGDQPHPLAHTNGNSALNPQNAHLTFTLLSKFAATNHFTLTTT